jgi:Xaa-Pro aminopeptidase
MARAGFDGLLISRQESRYYVTSYDTAGYSIFQGKCLGADRALALLTRSTGHKAAVAITATR